MLIPEALGSSKHVSPIAFALVAASSLVRKASIRGLVFFLHLFLRHIKPYPE
jgi:hypothetical protein